MLSLPICRAIHYCGLPIHTLPKMETTGEKLSEVFSSTLHSGNLAV